MSTHSGRIACTVLVALSAAAVQVAAQDEARRQFESGQYQAVVGAGDNSPGAQYLKGLAHLKLNQPDAAKEAFGRLAGADEAWKSVGQSAIALVDGNQDAALESARAAVARNGGLAEAQYQLGLALERADRAAAAEAFVKATQANPQMAYAHYYAGQNFYEAKQVAQMAVYFENFLKLAPNAPERPAVESIMRTIRGR
jgi:tetratricopeptide (TPR) repeat protein